MGRHVPASRCPPLLAPGSRPHAHKHKQLWSWTATGDAELSSKPLNRADNQLQAVNGHTGHTNYSRGSDRLCFWLPSELLSSQIYQIYSAVPSRPFFPFHVCVGGGWAGGVISIPANSHMPTEHQGILLFLHPRGSRCKRYPGTEHLRWWLSSGFLPPAKQDLLRG